MVFSITYCSVVCEGLKNSCFLLAIFAAHHWPHLRAEVSNFFSQCFQIIAESNFFSLYFLRLITSFHEERRWWGKENWWKWQYSNLSSSNLDNRREDQKRWFFYFGVKTPKKFNFFLLDPRTDAQPGSSSWKYPG